MRFLRTGLRDLQRKRRLRELEDALFLVKAGMERLEARLGMLEWNRAERFDSLKRPIGRIRKLQKEKAKLQGRVRSVQEEIQSLGLEGQRLERKRSVALEKLDGQIRELEAKYKNLQEWLEERDQKLLELEERIKDLSEEESQLIQDYAEAQQSDMEEEKKRARLAGLEERRAIIPKERKEAARRRDAMGEEYDKRQREHEQDYERLFALETERKDSQASFERQRKKLERQRKTLDKNLIAAQEAAKFCEQHKPAPFLAVGKHLADHGMGSSAETHLLPGIRAVRIEVGRLSDEIDLLKAASRTESWTDKFLFKMASYVLIALIVIGIGAGGWLWFSKKKSSAKEEAPPAPHPSKSKNRIPNPNRRRRNHEHSPFDSWPPLPFGLGLRDLRSLRRTGFRERRNLSHRPVLAQEARRRAGPRRDHPHRQGFRIHSRGDLRQGGKSSAGHAPDRRQQLRRRPSHPLQRRKGPAFLHRPPPPRQSRQNRHQASD